MARQEPHMRFLPVILALAAAVTALGLPSAGWSKDSQGNYAEHGVTCGKFVEARRSHTDFVDKWWLAGYLTAMNYEMPDTYSLVGSDDLSGSMLWLENWCIKNPLSDLTDGAQALVRELYPNRQKEGPK